MFFALVAAAAFGFAVRHGYSVVVERPVIVEREVVKADDTKK